MVLQQKILMASRISQLPEEEINKKFQELGPDWKIVFSTTHASVFGGNILYVTTVVVNKETDTMPASLENVMARNLFLEKGNQLHVRIRKMLNRYGISTVLELTGRTADQLYHESKNFGQLSLNEVRRRLAEHGFFLKGEGPNTE